MNMRTVGLGTILMVVGIGGIAGHRRALPDRYQELEDAASELLQRVRALAEDRAAGRRPSSD